MSACPAWKGPAVLLRDYPNPDLWRLLQCERDIMRRLGDNYGDTRANVAAPTGWRQRSA